MNISFPQSISSILRCASVILVAAALALTMGCSFSASSKSSSEILSSPFESSSRSSEGSDDEEYKEETKEYTEAYIESGTGDESSFQKGLSAIAARQGISDWEANPQTWTSVGRGLAGTKLSEQEVADYAETLSAGNSDAVSLVMQGYSEARL